MLSLDEYIHLTRLSELPEHDRMVWLLEDAAADVDAMTFHRIGTRGFDALSPFQQSQVKAAVARQADFRQQYADLLDNPLASYSINGVSMSWDKGAIRTMNGVRTCPAVVSYLMPTGLLYRGVTG